MLGIESPMFLLIPSESKERILRPGKVIEKEGDAILVEFEEMFTPPAGIDVNAYAEVRGKFFQQGAVVVAVEQSEPLCIIRLQMVGQPVSAESRGVFRVTTVTAGITARVGREKNCLVADVSPEGLAVLTTTQHATGSVVEINLAHEGQNLFGKARVQTLKVLPGGKNRYGLLIHDKKSPLSKALQKISLDLQRAQLRRLAGAA